MKPSLLVLAAGMGSRYGGLKQLDPVGPSGETIIDYSIYDAIRAGFGRVVFIIRKDIEDSFRAVIGNRYAGSIEVEYVYQELDILPDGFSVPETRRKPWGTGHAVLMAKGIINEPFAVINADDFYGRHGYRLLCDYLATAKDGKFADFCMCGFVLRRTLSENGTVSRGVCRIDKEGYLESVEELTKIGKNGVAARNTEPGQERDLTGNEIVSMNMWGFTPSVFGYLETMFREFLQAHGGEEKSEFFIPFAVDALIKSGHARVKVMESPDSWFGITYQADRETVVRSIRSLVAEGKYPEKLF